MIKQNVINIMRRIRGKLALGSMVSDIPKNELNIFSVGVLTFSP
jgi:hypothetical protein